jgi:hypothetical protein
MKFIGKIVLLLNEKSKKKRVFNVLSAVLSHSVFSIQFNEEDNHHHHQASKASKSKAF